jgi:hypothetical protein
MKEVVLAGRAKPLEADARSQRNTSEVPKDLLLFRTQSRTNLLAGKPGYKWRQAIFEVMESAYM